MAKMIKNLIRVFIILCSCISFSAFACRIGGLQHTIQFSPSDSAIGMNEAKKLADWYIDARDRIGISYAWFSTYYIDENKKTIPLSLARHDNIIRFLKSLDKDDVKIESGTGPLKDIPKEFRLSVMNEVNVGIQPKCAETDSCCGGGGRR
ncbi:hypothetical protein [Comamonas piscis]